MRILVAAWCLTGLLLLSAVSPAVADGFQMEPGFTPFFNGKDLSGWMTKKGDSLENKTEAWNNRFTVSDGKIVVDPKVKGDVIITTARELAGDVHIKFEYLPGPGCNNDLFFRGLKFDLKKGDVKNLDEGKWNTFEIVVHGKKVEFKNNGQTQRTGTAKVDSSVLGVRAEFGPIQFRRLRLKAER